MTANQSVSTPNKAKEAPKKENMNELRVAFNRVSIYDPLITFDFTDRMKISYNVIVKAITVI